MSLITNDAEEKLRHFVDSLRPTIRRNVLMADLIKYSAAITKAFRIKQTLKDIDLEVQRKRQYLQQQQQNKKSFAGPSRLPRPQGARDSKSSNLQGRMPRNLWVSHCARNATVNIIVIVRGG